MNPTDWARANLLTNIPRDISIWHWSAKDSIDRITRVIQSNGRFDEFRGGAVGRGLYVSTSAIDLMDRGSEVFYAKIQNGTKALIIDPTVFNVGQVEILEMELQRHGWHNFEFPPCEQELKKAFSANPPAMIEQLLEKLEVPCCVYVFGFYLAFMIRDSRCLLFDSHIAPASTVLKYHHEHPREKPMLAPHLLEQWLAKHSR